MVGCVSPILPISAFHHAETCLSADSPTTHVYTLRGGSGESLVDAVQFTVTLAGGDGDCHWQHAQLGRTVNTCNGNHEHCAVQVIIHKA